MLLRPLTDQETLETFNELLRRASSHQETCPTDTGLMPEVTDAIDAVARGTGTAEQAAEALADQLDGTLARRQQEQLQALIDNA